MARFQCGSVYYPKRSEVELQLDGALMERYLPVDDGESSRKPPMSGVLQGTSIH